MKTETHYIYKVPSQHTESGFTYVVLDEHSHCQAVALKSYHLSGSIVLPALKEISDEDKAEALNNKNALLALEIVANEDERKRLLGDQA